MRAVLSNSRRWVAVLGLLMGGAGSVQAADICEPLREHIEAQIAATGATGFAVVVVDAEAEVAGKVVGTCGKGARKLVYVRDAVRGGQSAATVRPTQPAAAAPALRTKEADIITECRDGSVVRGSASCKS